MKKLKAVVQYECMTSFKYIWVFYAIQYAFVLYHADYWNQYGNI